MNEIPALVSFPEAAVTWEEHPFELRFKDFKQLIERAPRHVVNQTKEIIGKPASNLLVKWLTIALGFLLLAS